MSRREFSKKTKLAAWQRSGGKCEKCTRKLAPGDIHYDHVIPDALGGEPSLDNCAVLCRSCHSEKTTKVDVPTIAKATRQRQRNLGIRKPKARIPSPPKAEKRPSKPLPERRSLYRDAS